MFIRQLISYLFIASLTLTTMARPPVRQDDTSNQPNQLVLTPEEEREARALAEEFITRLEQSGDVTPLVNELYVSDFTERFRNRIDNLFPLTATPEVAAQMSSDDILRAYTASINCMFLAVRLYLEVERKRKLDQAQRGDSSEPLEDQEPTIDEIIPPRVIKLIESDPALAALLAQARKEEQDERRNNGRYPAINNSSSPELSRDPVLQTQESLEDFFPFKSLEQMRHYTSLLEQGVKLLREHIDSLPPHLKPSVREYMSESANRSTDDETESTVDDINPRLDVLENEYMGYSAGTHIICANALVFHVEMVRGDDGNLKVLNVYLVMD